ncbi:hypothetical protein [Sphingomonas sp. Leaf208]|uniref:hypothetical protein n=1 Tax=Sphingomonas sp. Leaf208 TaxID=1735679 RepID=UPI000B0E02FF|nr:hypothetical protein [Sphingomonas sp. Leaf208]
MPSKSPRRISHRHRPASDWVGRIALFCGVAVLGYQSIIFSVSQVAAKSRPASADAIISYDGRLIAAHAATLLTPTVNASERAKAAALSRAALRNDPTAVSAAATLGLVTLAQGDVANGKRLLAYAQMLSRRNFQTQLWSIEEAVGRGDVAGALRWYDIALRTKPDVSNILFPVLAGASHDPAIRTALVQTLAGNPLWANSYINFAAGQKDDPKSTASLFVDLRAHGVTIPASAQAAVINILLNAGNVDQAWRYYATIRPGVDRTRARDPRFAAMLETPSAFDWTTLSDNSIAISIQRTREGGMFEFSMPASIGGPVLQQIQLLPPGSYRLAGHSDGIAQDANALPYWMLTCRSNGSELGRVPVPNSAQTRGMFVGTLTVPANCPVQTLTLFAQPSDKIGGTSGQIYRVALTPLNAQGPS